MIERTFTSYRSKLNCKLIYLYRTDLSATWEGNVLEYYSYLRRLSAILLLASFTPTFQCWSFTEIQDRYPSAPTSCGITWCATTALIWDYVSPSYVQVSQEWISVTLRQLYCREFVHCSITGLDAFLLICYVKPLKLIKFLYAMVMFAWFTVAGRRLESVLDPYDGWFISNVGINV